jgi:hypothetical protein
MTTTTTNCPDVPLPAGTETYTGWEHDSNGTRRIIWGAARQVDTTQISLQPHAIQLADGSIDVNIESAGDRPGIAIDEICDGDGNTRDCVNVTLDGARHLVAALIVLIDEVDAWVAQ